MNVIYDSRPFYEVGNQTNPPNLQDYFPHPDEAQQFDLDGALVTAIPFSYAAGESNSGFLFVENYKGDTALSWVERPACGSCGHYLDENFTYQSPFTAATLEFTNDVRSLQLHGSAEVLD